MVGWRSFFFMRHWTLPTKAATLSNQSDINYVHIYSGTVAINSSMTLTSNIHRHHLVTVWPANYLRNGFKPVKEKVPLCLTSPYSPTSFTAFTSPMLQWCIWRSSKVIGNYNIRYNAHEFVLVFHCNDGHIAVSSPSGRKSILGTFWAQKSCLIATTLVLFSAEQYIHGSKNLNMVLYH